MSPPKGDPKEAAGGLGSPLALKEWKKGARGPHSSPSPARPHRARRFQRRRRRGPREPHVSNGPPALLCHSAVRTRRWGRLPAPGPRPALTQRQADPGDERPGRGRREQQRREEQQQQRRREQRRRPSPRGHHGARGSDCNGVLRARAQVVPLDARAAAPPPDLGGLRGEVGVRVTWPPGARPSDPRRAVPLAWLPEESSPGIAGRRAAPEEEVDAVRPASPSSAPRSPPSAPSPFPLPASWALRPASGAPAGGAPGEAACVRGSPPSLPGHRGGWSGGRAGKRGPPIPAPHPPPDPPTAAPAPSGGSETLGGEREVWANLWISPWGAP